MACFLVPATEAAVTTIAEHVVKGKEERANKEELTLSENSKTPFSHKLKWLNHMLWGGSALLAFEHIWHGEVTPWFPFLTAAGNPEDAMAMLHEMATTGIAMAVPVPVKNTLPLILCTQLPHLPATSVWRPST